jgi:hypothetical protein
MYLKFETAGDFQKKEEKKEKEKWLLVVIYKRACSDLAFEIIDWASYSFCY